MLKNVTEHLQVPCSGCIDHVLYLENFFMHHFPLFSFAMGIILIPVCASQIQSIQLINSVNSIETDCVLGLSYFFP